MSKTVGDLRKEGCAVVVFQPHEFIGLAQEQLEEYLASYGESLIAEKCPAIATAESATEDFISDVEARWLTDNGFMPLTQPEVYNVEVLGEAYYVLGKHEGKLWFYYGNAQSKYLTAQQGEIEDWAKPVFDEWLEGLQT